MDHLHQSNDVVIIDAPPLLPVTDALVMAPMTDGVILVIDYGGTRIGEARQGKTQLDQSGARLLGVVMNKIPTGRRGYAYYYYYQRYYTDDGGSKQRRSKGRRHSSAGQVGNPAVTLDSSPESSHK